MAETKVHRKLAAILSADVVGYSKLMADDEAATVTTLKQYRAAIGHVIERHEGRIVNAPGDNILAEFASAVEAVQGAVEIQKSIEGRNVELPDDRRMHFRVGVNLGDVIEEDDGTIYGDGVNIAARMEALAEEGGICISSTIYDAVEGKLDFGFDFLGEQQVKNIAKPVRVYRVRDEPGEKPKKQKSGRTNKLAMVAAAGVLVIAIAGVLIWQIGRGPATEETETAAADDPVLALPTGPSIAVLPFVNMSGDPEQEYFADGLTEELITALSRFQDLKVIARHSTLQYKNAAVDVRKVASDLGVNYIAEGSVRRSAATLRITVQLIDGKDGSHLWSDTYDRPLTASDVFAIQDEVAGTIVGRIAGSYGIINQDNLAASRTTPPDSLSAYECVLRAYEFLEVYTPEAHAENRDCLEQAVELDPDYAEAWQLLGGRYAEEYVIGFNPRPNSLERALEANRKAVRLDPDSQMTHYGLAWVLFFSDNREEFFAHADKAIALNSNNPLVLADLGNLFRLAGKREKGLAMTQKAIELNPHHPGWYWLPFSWDNYYHRRDYMEALKFAKLASMPRYESALLVMAAAYGQLGDIDNARAALETLSEVKPGYSMASAREFAARWRIPPEYQEHVIEGLRKAGLSERQAPK